jgi:hypothetical protein
MREIEALMASRRKLDVFERLLLERRELATWRQTAPELAIGMARADGRVEYTNRYGEKFRIGSIVVYTTPAQRAGEAIVRTSQRLGNQRGVIQRFLHDRYSNSRRDLPDADVATDSLGRVAFPARYTSAGHCDLERHSIDHLRPVGQAHDTPRCRQGLWDRPRMLPGVRSGRRAVTPMMKWQAEMKHLRRVYRGTTDELAREIMEQRMVKLDHLMSAYSPSAQQAQGRRGVIRTWHDLLRHFGLGEDATVSQLNRVIYRDTECGASISVYGNSAQEGYAHIARHAGSREPLPPDFRLTSFTIQTIVEGSDATIGSGTLQAGIVTDRDIDEWITGMEEQSDYSWNEAHSDERDED